jgi:hypothetical protein
MTFRIPDDVSNIISHRHHKIGSRRMHLSAATDLLYSWNFKRRAEHCDWKKDEQAAY